MVPSKMYNLPVLANILDACVRTDFSWPNRVFVAFSLKDRYSCPEVVMSAPAKGAMFLATPHAEAHGKVEPKRVQDRLWVA
jgi:hypothetical protein